MLESRVHCVRVAGQMHVYFPLMKLLQVQQGLPDTEDKWQEGENRRLFSFHIKVLSVGNGPEMLFLYKGKSFQSQGNYIFLFRFVKTGGAAPAISTKPS